MMPEQIATTTQEAVARPLAVLLPLIQNDLQRGREAAVRAALPHYSAAGEKLLEAKAQLKHGEFTSWVRMNFKLSVETARHYMRLATHAAAESGSALPFSSLSDFVRQTSNPNYNRPSSAPPLKTVTTDPDLARKNDLYRRQIEERRAQRELALEVIRIGYKAVAQRLHPDKGGSREAMVRLNIVRNRMKGHA